MAVASARPRFLAIPLEDVEFVRGPYPVPHHRVVRRAGESHLFSNFHQQYNLYTVVMTTFSP